MTVPALVGAPSATGVVLQGTYTLGAQIGHGGMGEVYEATHVRLPGRFAVKMLRPALLTNQEAVSRFCREAEIMSSLRHPHIVQIFDFNTSAEGLPYFVMEHLDGVDLETRLAAGGAMSLVALVRVVEATASALGAAHALGIVHRDLKPANIFLVHGSGQDDDFVKVLDFGISKTADAADHLSSASVVMGTPEFMAPEQALGHSDEVGPGTDQFALAAIAYVMLTGREPFAGGDPASLLYQVVHEPPPPLSTFFSWDTRGIQAVLDRGLAKRPGDRFDDIVELASSLRRAASAASRRTREGRPAVRTPSSRPVARLLRLAPPPIRVAQRRAPAALGPSIDRIPYGRRRAVALALGVLGFAGAIVHNGWYRGFTKHAVALEREVVSLVTGEGRAPRPAAAAPRAPAPRFDVEVLPPRVPTPPDRAPAEAAALDADAIVLGDVVRAEAHVSRHIVRGPAGPVHHLRRISRSRWRTVFELPTRPPSSRPELVDVPSLPPAFQAPERFPDPSLTPPPQPPPPLAPDVVGPGPSLERVRPSADDPMPPTE